ncbi:SDR family oxidoreductase [Neisseria sp. Ec49-e6-T10]|uniref:SDR family oxidoreductase n=1 Tax=Neisseria sp. Ec49-e6-T10 TaxID=3140744 RepID=UPI003EBA9887
MHKTWFITGASSGFGLIMTEKLLQRGDQVAVTIRKTSDRKAIDLLKEKHQQRLHIFELDLTSSFDEIEKVVKQVFTVLPQIDVLVSNAGYVLLGALEELNETQIQQQISTNLLGPIFLIKAFVPYFRAQRKGHIVQVSSEAGQISYPALTAYHASKWGVEGFCESLARELVMFNIKVTIIEPGRTATLFDDNAVLSETLHPEYQKTTVGNYRRLIAMGKFPNVGNAHKVVDAMISVTEQDQAPIRLTLGSDAFRNIHKALSGRLKALEDQKEQAFSTDIHKHNDI